MALAPNGFTPEQSPGMRMLLGDLQADIQNFESELGLMPSGMPEGFGSNPLERPSAPLGDRLPLRLHPDVWCPRFLVDLLDPAGPHNPVPLEHLSHPWWRLCSRAGGASVSTGTGCRRGCPDPASTKQQQPKTQGKPLHRHSACLVTSLSTCPLMGLEP